MLFRRNKRKHNIYTLENIDCIIDHVIFAMPSTASFEVSNSTIWSTMDLTTTYNNRTDNEMMYNITQTDINEPNLLAAVIFVGCLSGIGVPGNILVLLVFSLKHKPSVYRTIILTLTMYDTLLCGITLPFEIYDMHNNFTFRAGEWTCKLFRTFNYFLVFNSGYTVLFMAIDRFRRVVRPLKIQMSLRHAHIGIVVIFIVSVVLTIPNLFIRGIHVVRLRENVTGYDCTISDEYTNSNVPTIYNLVLLLLCIATISVLIFLYIWIGHEIIVHFRYRKDFKSTRREKPTRCNSIPSTADGINSISKNCVQNEKNDLNTAVNLSETSGNGTLRVSHKTETSKHGTVKNGGISGKGSISMSRKSGRSKFKKMDEHGYKITKIAIAISLFYILSYIPSLIENILVGIYGVDVVSLYISPAVMNILERTYAINHVINPIIYGFIDDKFNGDCKSVFISLFRKCKC